MLFKRVTRNFLRGQGPNPQKRAQKQFFKEDIAWKNIFQI